ncbi:hypothetical protein Tco_0313978 [Tanacetum coccineum]
MPIKSNEPPDPLFDEFCALTKVTSAEDLSATLFSDTKVKVLKFKHRKPHKGVKISTPGSAGARSILRRLRSAKALGKARDRNKESPGDNRCGKRVVSTPMNDEINKVLSNLSNDGSFIKSHLDNSGLNDLGSPVAKSCGLKTSHDHTSMGDVGNTGVGIASSKDGITIAETGILSDREKAGPEIISERTSIEDVVSTGVAQDILQDGINKVGRGFVFGKMENTNGILKKHVGPFFSVQFGNVSTSNPFMKKSVAPKGGAWNSVGTKSVGPSILSNQFSADVDRFVEKLKQGTEEIALKMEYVPNSVSKLENGNRRISFSAEEIYKGGQACSLQLYGYFVGTSMDYRVVRGNEKGLVLNVWEPGIWLEKTEPSSIPIWVCVYSIPMELYNGCGIGKIMSGVGKPLLMDKMTRERCLKKAGKMDFARVLVEVSAEDDLPNILEIEYPPLGIRPARVGKLEVKYQWRPPLCTHCKTFGHSILSCKVRPRTEEEIAAKAIKDAIKLNNPVVAEKKVDIDEGFVTVGRKNRPMAPIAKFVPVRNVNDGYAKPGNNFSYGNQKQNGDRQGVNGDCVSGFMERGFLDNSDKKKKDEGSKEDDGSTQVLSGLAKRVKNIEGKLTMPKGILKNAIRKVAADTKEVVVPLKDMGKVTKDKQEIVKNLNGENLVGGDVNVESAKSCSLADTQGNMGSDQVYKEGLDSGSSFASKLRPKAVNNKVHFRTLVNEENIDNSDCVLPRAAAAKVKSRYENSIVRFFVEKDPSFHVVQQYVNNTWNKFGFEKITRNDDGVYLFKFASKSGMDQVLEKGPWIIRKSPIILNKWTSSVSLKKGEVTKVPVWVKLYNVPVLAYSEDGLSLIATQIAIPEEEGDGHINEVIRVEYEWTPPHYGECKTFGHTLSMCPKRVMEATSSSTKSNPKSAPKSTNVADHDGFIEVNNRKNKGKNQGKPTRIDGIRLTKPKASFYQVKKGPKNDQTQTTNQSKASTSRSAPSKNSTPMSNSFDTLSKLVEEGINDLQGKDDGSVQTGFKGSTEAPVETIGLPSKECINESDTDDDDVFTSYGLTLGGGNQLEDEDLDFSDGYEAQVFDLPGQLKNFRDFKLNMCGAPFNATEEPGQSNFGGIAPKGVYVKKSPITSGFNTLYRASKDPNFKPKVLVRGSSSNNNPNLVSDKNLNLKFGRSLMKRLTLDAGIYPSKQVRIEWTSHQLDCFYKNCHKFHLSPYCDDDEEDVESDTERIASDIKPEFGVNATENSEINAAKPDIASKDPNFKPKVLVRGSSSNNNPNLVSDEAIPVKKSFNVLRDEDKDVEDVGNINVNEEFESKIWSELNEKFHLSPYCDDDEEDVESDTEGIASDMKPEFAFAWNVRGLNNTPNQDQVIQLLREDNYSLCGLLETHVKKKNLSRICNHVLGNWEWVSNVSSCIGGTRIIVGWDPNSIRVMVLEHTSQVLHCFVEPVNGDANFFCSFVYVAIHTIDRRSLWKALHKHKLAVKDRLWVILGDFNACLDPFESTSGCSKVESLVEDMYGIPHFGISVGDAVYMIRDISDNEIKAALFDIDNNKAPGPDGYSSQFFKDAWNVIGKEFCKAVRDFFISGKLLKEVNSTVISLVPKISTPRRVSGYRPIACCNVVYKCISKIMVNRIKGCLDSLVDQNQSAFIPSRQISDNVLLSQELLRGYHRKRGYARCAFKVDIQKAFDSMEWSFLRDCLTRFGFHREEGFEAALSPYLFTLVMEVLNLMIKRKCKDLKITHLCFADDMMLFCHGDSKSVSVLKNLLDEFGSVSGLFPSFPKSTVFFGNVRETCRTKILNVMSFIKGKLSVRYFGVPLLSKRLYVNDCSVLVYEVK